MTRERRTRQRLIDALNGDVESVEATVRRGLMAIADEADGLHEENRELRRHFDVSVDQLAARFDEKIDALKEQTRAVQKTLYGVGASMVTIIIGAAITVFFTR